MLRDRRLSGLAKYFAMVAALALTAGTLAACGDDDPTTTTAAAPLTVATAEATQAGTPGEAVDVSIALDWYPWGNHSGLYLAQANGYFEDEGLNVNIYVPGDPATGLQLVATGRDTFTISYQTDVLLARAEGLEVVSVAALVQHPLNSIMALESSGIERPSDLAGRTIGMAGVASDEPLLRSMLEADGLTLDDVELVTVGFDLMPALLGGTVDAVIGAYWVHESILVEQQGESVNVIRIEDWGVPDHYELLLVTGERFAAENPEVVERFIRAMRLGYADADADREAAIDALVVAAPETDRELELEGIELLAPLWTDDGTVAFGTQTEERWETYAAWLLENDILTQDIPVGEAFTNEFVERASR
ncbi:MAG TPA: ABC transporter substrate-binding protein [Thermomicrobiales bacterium]|nr:ABC transporter substrate-binding protein [Thermomicrobiales bacterium]